MGDSLEQLLQNLSGAPEWMKVVLLGISTLVSEDLTTIGAGMLASGGHLHIATALLGCFLGIFIGDGLLYFVGLLFGKPILRWRLFRRFLPESKVEECARWFEKNGIMVVLLSRFLPGTRLPTYFAAGLLGSKAKHFLPAAALATGLWTPILIFISWHFGEQMQGFIQSHETYAVPLSLLGMILLYLLLRFMAHLGDWKFRRRLRSRLKRLTRWEFWPIATLYFPLVVYNFLQIFRYRRTALPLIANPGIELSGFIGESKTEIMESLRRGLLETGESDSYLPQFLEIDPHHETTRQLEAIRQWMEKHRLTYPIVMKPDAGQRGIGVAVVRRESDVSRYLKHQAMPIHVQEYAPGPYEFGISYLRFPDQEKGRIIGVTGKEFLQAAGDGRHTLEELILRHPLGMGRYHFFLKRFRHRLNQILAPGESLPLVEIGNHCLGTIFNDSGHLLTASIEENFDRISKAVPGFYCGRYDIRVQKLEDFRLGKAFKIVELNGATGEPSFMYDARHGIWFAWKTLIKQYSALWQIGYLNAQNGTPGIPLGTLIKAYFRYRKQSKPRKSKNTAPQR